jgi:MFS family permease
LNILKSGTAKISIHYFLTSSGYFSIMSTLVVMLNSKISAASVGLVVGIFLFSSKVAKIPLASRLDRIPPEITASVGCLLASLAFLSIGFMHAELPITLTLIAAAIGVSMNSIASKQLSASVADLVDNRAKLYSIVNIVINFSSAMAAPVALYFVGIKQYHFVMIAVSGMYLAAALYVYSNFKSDHKELVKTKHSSFGAYLDIFNIKGMPRFLAINFFGCFLYGQLFNAFALYVSVSLGMPAHLGWLYSLNAIMIIVLQLPVTHLAQRYSSKNSLHTHSRTYFVFLIAFLLPFLITGYLGVILFVVTFTLAEMLFIPNVDVRLLELIGRDNRAVAYGVLSLSSGLGEAIGGSSGIYLYRAASHFGSSQGYWLVMAIVASLFIALTVLLSQRSR